MEHIKPIVLQPSIWDTDNLGDLVAEGVVDCDDLSLRAVAESQKEEYLRLSREWDEKLEDYWNSIGWEEFKKKYQSFPENEVF